MRHLIIIGLFLICTQTKAQSKGYVTITPAFYIFEDGGSAAGGHISGNGKLAKGLFIGIETGFLKLQDLRGVYVPIQAKFSIIPGKDPNKISFMFFLQPGYGAYKSDGNFGTYTSGGFSFYGGGGAVFPSKGKAHLVVNAGYSVFGFKTDEVKTHVAAFGLKLGLMLR